ncbi:hypothetical protein CCACVL1_02247, partial [Corchorus capsularis]
DLNLFPELPQTTSAPNPSVVTTTAPPTPFIFLTPKIEPKQEPLDEPVLTPTQTPQQREYFLSSLSNSTPNFLPNSETTPLSTNTSSSTNDQTALYSEYFRISELFRTAFAKRLQKYGDVDVLDPDSQAIVPVPEEQPPEPEPNPERALSVVVSRQNRGRSNELVRVTNLGIEDQRHFRDVVRRTRMMYDALRILAISEEEKRKGPGQGRRARGDLRAAQVMRERGLWLNRDKRIVGPIPGIEIGDIFFFRMELCVMGLHGQAQAGIDYLPGSQSSNGEPIATSIIVSGGYEDDEDSGDSITYTGHGGQDKFSRQCMHQKLEGGNLALERSMHYGIESRENLPVFLFNDIDSDHDPVYYDYLKNTVFPPYAFAQGANITGCECVSGCTEGCICAMKNGGEFAYDHNGLLLRGKPVIFECGINCKCPPTCRNRVSQHGLRHRLEIFRSKETGWGVRSLDLIQAGAFICEYAGVVLTKEQAQVFTMNGDTLIYPGRFSERWAEWGDLSQIFTEYVRPTYPSIPPLDFAMDVSRMRNVACYMSHSISPNVLVQYVLYDHNNFMFPHLMLFAMENIPPLRELSIDYGVADEWNAKLSICN